MESQYKNRIFWEGRGDKGGTEVTRVQTTDRTREKKGSLLKEKKY